MTQLARSHGHGLLSLAEISRTESLPLAYLEQLIGELRRAGLVEGVRGLHGGYRLTRTPSEITVGEVYRVLEGPIAPVECTAADYLPHSCDREEGCLSRSVWERVQDAISGVLDATTLNDLCNTGRGAPARYGSGLIAVDMITGARATVREGCLKSP
jgi:Rrf2 family cysteine metabolism transcriptional repressor